MTQPTLADQQWLDRVIAAGMPVVDTEGNLHDGTNIAEREAAQAKVEREVSSDLPSIIPIRPTHAEHTITVTDIHGVIVHLRPVIRWGTTDESDWYGQMIKNRKADLALCEEKAQMLDLADEIRGFQRDQLQLYIPELPPNLLSRIDPSQYAIIWTALRRMEFDGQKAVEEAQKKMLEPLIEERRRNAK